MMNNFQQWQKNKNYLGSSETIRETSINDIWWFIGFVEGDGSFIVSKDHMGKTRLFFIINQKDPRVLWKVKSILGIGKVSKYNNFHRYVLTKHDHILFLIYLFNGRLLLNKTNERFKLWLLTKKYSNIVYKSNDYNSFTLKNAWFAGFIEAEGCFNGQFKENLKRNGETSLQTSLRFKVDQKNELNLLRKIKESFNCGHVYHRKNKEYALFEIGDHDNLVYIIEYLDIYSLKGVKNISFVRFKKIWNRINLKQHLDIPSLKVKNRLINLIKSINKIDEDRVL